MAKFNTSALTQSVRTAESSAVAANKAWDDMKGKYEAALKAIREYNTSLDTTREAFEAAVRDAENVRNNANDLAATIATLPEPIPEPPVGPLPPTNGDGEEGDVTVRGKVVSRR